MHGRNTARLLALIGLGAASLDAHAAGYLAMVGPSSLRFEEPSRQTRPPAAEPVPVVVTVTNVVTVTVTEPARPDPAPAPVVGTQPVQTISEAIGDFLGGQPPDSQYAPPSVLLRFFKDTNGADGAVVVPVGFVPPVEQPKPFKSTATYSRGQ